MTCLFRGIQPAERECSATVFTGEGRRRTQCRSTWHQKGMMRHVR
jgi:hypothetical protein